MSTETASFLANRSAAALITSNPVAVSLGGSLLHYRDGSYRPEGEEWARREVAAMLGDDWRKGRAEEVVAYLRATAPRLWDQPPVDRINLANGIFDLRSGRLEDHDPDFLSPVQLPVAYDPSAQCPAIDRFLDEVLGAEMATLVHEIAGYLCVPDNSLQTAFMLLGEGANGKSVLLSLLTSLIGRRNVSSVPLHHLDENRFAVAELQGRLANVFADLDARALAASSMFKSITGGDAITGERKHQSPFSFTPYARLLFSANEPPPTPDSTDAFFRRWVAIPFERSFKGRAADPHLLDRLTTPGELSGLLNHGIAALAGLREARAFTATESTERAARRFRVDSDSVAGFIEDSCDRDLDGRVQKSHLFPAYKQWCQESNRGALGKQKFNRRVEATPGVEEGVVNGVRYWSGLSLRGDS